MRNTMITEGSDDEQYSSDESKSDSDLNDVETAPDRVNPHIELRKRVQKKSSVKHSQCAKDRIILPLETLPSEPLQTKGQKGVGKRVNYKTMVNSSADLEYRVR